MSKENLKKDTLDKNIWTVLSNSNIALEEELLNKSKLNEAIRAIGIILTKEDLREQFFQPKKREQLEKIIKNADHLFQSILWKNSALGPQLIDAVKNSIGEDYPNIKIIKGILSLRLPTKNADGTEEDSTVHHMISKLYNLPKIKGNNIEYDSEYGSEYGSESEFTPQDNTADKMSSDVKNLLENSNSKDTSGKWLTYENYVKNSMRNYVNDFNYRSEYYDYEPPEYHEEPEKFLQQCRIKFIESCFYRIPNSRSFQEKVGHKISEELRELNNKMLEGIWDIKRESFLPKNNQKLE